jgi:hypothetical protein
MNLKMAYRRGVVSEFFFSEFCVTILMIVTQQQTLITEMDIIKLRGHQRLVKIQHKHLKDIFLINSDLV